MVDLVFSYGWLTVRWDLAEKLEGLMAKYVIDANPKKLFNQGHSPVGWYPPYHPTGLCPWNQHAFGLHSMQSPPSNIFFNYKKKVLSPV